jgi:hypothetical protein
MCFAWVLSFTAAASLTGITVAEPLPEARGAVTLSLRGTPLREALAATVGQAPIPYVVESDVPDVPVTVSLRIAPRAAFERSCGKPLRRCRGSRWRRRGRCWW